MHNLFFIACNHYRKVRFVHLVFAINPIFKYVTPVGIVHWFKKRIRITLIRVVILFDSLINTENIDFDGDYVLNMDGTIKQVTFTHHYTPLQVGHSDPLRGRDIHTGSIIFYFKA